MKLFIVSIVLDGMAFLPMQLATFNRLKCDWTWHIAEGVADNVKDTSWCAKITPRLSTDGTTEFLNSLRSHPRVRVYQRQLWPGKTAMFNHMLAQIKHPGLLLQVDVDELWTPCQIEKLAEFFERHKQFQFARFFSRYFVGPNIVTIGEDSFGNNPGEWVRAWRFQPGMNFVSHEPPVLAGARLNGASRNETRQEGLVFDHWSYVFGGQLRFKQEYYNYPNALEHWMALQRNRQWPVKLKKFLPWVDENAQADLLHK